MRLTSLKYLWLSTVLALLPLVQTACGEATGETTTPDVVDVAPDNGSQDNVADSNVSEDAPAALNFWWYFCKGVKVSDNNYCTRDTCSLGVVVHTPIVPKSDNNACTVDACNPATGKTLYTAVAVQDDNNSCTTDVCNTTTGQTDHLLTGSGQMNACGGCGSLDHQPNEACTSGSGQCQGTGVYQCSGQDAVVCTAQSKPDGTKIADDGNACTNDLCTAGAEIHTALANGTICDDGNVCTQVDTCQSGACSGGSAKVCTAYDQCHDVGTCNSSTGVCSNPVKTDGTVCADGNACTTGDHCQAGVCTASATGTTNTCGGCSTLAHQPNEACTAGSGQCQGSGTYQCSGAEAVVCNAQAKVNGTTCSDGNACTQTDTCQSGSCAGGNPKVCSALDQCHSAGTCAAATGVCSNPNKTDGTSCSDGNSCTTGDQCVAGACAGTGSCSSGSSKLTAVWAGEGGDKVAQEELRASQSPASVINSTWDGSKIKIFGAKNEVVNFDLVLEAATSAASSVSVSLGELDGPSGAVLHYKAASGDALFNWVGREIELFYVRYLEIKGLSAFCCQKDDERQIPEKLRRPYDSYGIGTGTWTDRPDHNKHYPDIAVPLELTPTFNVAAAQNQSVWVDIYIPTGSPAGLYTGNLLVKENGTTTRTIPVELTVRNFALPDEPTAKTMLFFGYPYVNERYFSDRYPYATQEVADMHTVRNRHFMMAHRHKISLIDADLDNDVWTADQPHPEWLPRLNGSLFTANNGYEGPGTNTGNNIYSIGTYGSWGWQSQGESGMWQHTNGWANWFAANVPGAEYFLYLIDESSNYAQTEQWARWINENPGPGKNVMSMATNRIIDAKANMPSLDIPTSGMYVGDRSVWQTAADQYEADPNKRVYFYNGGRPASGSFMTEDDGVALRELAWGQYKKGVDRWYYWESTYYDDFQSGNGVTDLFHKARTFGYVNATPDSLLGETGYNYSNGDGVLFYPGTDRKNTADSYGIKGPIASLRLKYWRRGVEDVDYLALAYAIDPVATQQIIDQTVPKALWEYGVTDPTDPTWVRADISWSNDPDVWETARRQLADIIE